MGVSQENTAEKRSDHGGFIEERSLKQRGPQQT